MLQFRVARFAGSAKELGAINEPYRHMLRDLGIQLQDLRSRHRRMAALVESMPSDEVAESDYRLGSLQVDDLKLYLAAMTADLASTRKISTLFQVGQENSTNHNRGNNNNNNYKPKKEKKKREEKREENKRRKKREEKKEKKKREIDDELMV